ncbi:hypothetical protein CDD80_7224 [Ophiocordyceps camponoti-rufipedis]|uniref:Secreted protein n=1 Tax=Ophiocordyceps camponoti-rufipedis TaxID=2004952 RepID=A0A2C5ZEQ7_9HYPO|nr:hypothetical protein CDD80_7224 [Ophiocordyceps camponoti-rufipedis]
MVYLNLSTALVMSSIFSALPINGSTRKPPPPRGRPDYRQDPAFKSCQARLPNSSCVSELFFALGERKFWEACQPGGRLSGHEPLFFNVFDFVHLGRPTVCARPVWEPARCGSFSTVAFAVEQYGPICKTCFPSKL